MAIRDFFAQKRYKENQPVSNRRLINMSGGTLIDQSSAMEVSAFYRGLVYISQQIAKIPWNVKSADNVIQSSHKVNTLLDMAPNSEMNSMTWRLKIIQEAIMNGNHYSEIVRDTAGRVVALWPMLHSDVFPYRESNTGELKYRIIGGGRAGNDVTLDRNEVYHIRNFHTIDGIVGLGLLDYASEILGIAKGADRLANSLYANSGMPSAVLETDRTLSEDVVDRLIESWKQKYGGRKTGGTAILEEGLKYKSTMIQPDVLQFLETRKFNVVEIARFLGLPPTKLFDTEVATFNNIENSNLEVATDTLDAWARNLEAEADVKLLNNRFKGYKTEMNMHAIFRGDMKTRGQYWKDRMQTGSITPNDILLAEGGTPYEGGDRYFVATNNYTPADRIDEVIDSQLKGKKDNNLDDAVAKYLKNVN